MPEGLSIRTNSLGIPILRLHYRADPTRNDDWVSDMKPKMSEAMWNQEQEIDYSAAGGERVLRALLERRWKEIVITDPAFEFDPGWRYSNGLDYGKTHPCALIAGGTDFDGTRYAISEAYRKGLTPAQHMPEIKRMRLPCVENAMNPLILTKALWTSYDPSMGYANMATEDSFTSGIALFEKAGFPRLREGIRGQDLLLVDQITEAWSGTQIKFKIVCRNMPFPVEPGSMKMREGVWENGCPNLLWELLNIRRKDRSALRQETVGPAEGLVDKENDAWDALKYWWTSEEIIPQVSRERKWSEQVEKIRKKNPAIDLTTLSIMHAKFEREMNKQETHSWR